MTEADRDFLSVVVQIVPVLLLTAVIEARLFRFEMSDAVPGVKAARTEARERMHPVVYLGWRARAAYRRSGISTLTILLLVAVLATMELAGLWLLASDQHLPLNRKYAFVFGILVAVLFLGVKPVFQKIVDQNVQLVELEERVRLAVEQERAQDAPRSTAKKQKVGKPESAGRSKSDSRKKRTPTPPR